MERTRGAIIQAFDQLLDEKPINKITVKDIVGRCNINRNTFYYHFSDIPALVEQIMEDMAAQLVQNHFQPGEPIECIRPVIQYGLRNKNKLLHIYRYVARETSIAYLNRIAQGILRNYFDNLAVDSSVSAENIADLTRFYRCAIVGLLLDWLDGEMKDDMMALAQRLCVLLRGTGKLALRR